MPPLPPDRDAKIHAPSRSIAAATPIDTANAAMKKIAVATIHV
jgi:hypothetical protein